MIGYDLPDPSRNRKFAENTATTSKTVIGSFVYTNTYMHTYIHAYVRTFSTFSTVTYICLDIYT